MAEFVQPMQACPVEYEDTDRKCPGYLIEPKLDGIRCIAVKQDNTVELFTRTGHSLTEKLPHIVDELRRVPGDWVLDGEVGYESSFMTWPQIDFNKTVRVTGSGIDEALRKQREESDLIVYYVFDILREGHYGDIRSFPLWRRYNILKALFVTTSVETSLITHVQQINDGVEPWYTQYVEEGGEGVMLKNPDAPYHSGKRPARTWYKLKAFNTTDVVITGYLDGQGKYEGQIGAIRFGQYDAGENDRGEPVLVPLGKCSGMDDAFRQRVSDHRDEYLGMVMEIKYFGKVGQGEEGLRHPQFLRLRPDKGAHECTMD